MSLSGAERLASVYCLTTIARLHRWHESLSSGRVFPGIRLPDISGKWLGKSHPITVVSPKPKWNWIPSNIWVGVGEMTEKQVTFELAPIYKKLGVDFRQAGAVSIHPEGGAEHTAPYVTIEYTDPARLGQTDAIEYDYLVNATGPKLNFGATPGLGPDGGYSLSVCTPEHAKEANAHLRR
jgi:sulfide:quinone oxidoreductase